MRVVLVTPGFPTSLDDHHKPFLADHARALATAGADVTVVCPAHPDAPRRHEVGGIEVRRVRFAPARIEARVALGESYRVFAGLSALWVIPMIASLTLAAARQVRRRSAADSGDSAHSDNPDNDDAVVHGHWWFPCGLIAVAAAVAAGRRTTSVVHIHGSDAAVTTNLVHRWLARRVLRRAGAVATVSDDLRSWAASLMPRPADPNRPPRSELVRRRSGQLLRGSIQRGPLLTVVSMPVGADRLGTPKPIPTDGPVVAIGRLMAEKGFDVLIEAAALMPESLRSPVVIVGDGPDRALLEALALRREVSVTFAGAVTPTQVGDWYRRARIICVPSRREGFGMVVAEALAAGRPVVATAVGAAPLFITDGTSGRLVPPGDPKALAEALTAALQSHAEVVAPTHSDALAPFRPEAHATTLLELYQEIAQS